MAGRIDYPHLPEGASPQLKNELWKMVEQINAAISELERRLESK